MPRRIRRYDNRKLYDTEASEYVSLADIADLVRHGETVEVVDKETGQDLTAQTLTQVILEEGKNGQQLLQSDLLHDLLRHSGEMIDSGLDLVRSTVEELMTSSLSRLQQIVQSPRSEELDELRQQLRKLEHRLAVLLEELEEKQPESNDRDPPTDDSKSSVASDPAPTSSRE